MAKKRQRCYSCGRFKRPPVPFCKCCRKLVLPNTELEVRVKRQRAAVAVERELRVQAHARRVETEMRALGIVCRATEETCQQPS